jgi:hypothetical protein
VFAFHEKEGQGVTFSLSHFPYLGVTFSLSLDREDCFRNGRTGGYDLLPFQLRVQATPDVGPELN